jgi:hypothetical protein
MKTKYFFLVLLFLNGSAFSKGTAQIPNYGLLATCFYCGYAGPNAFNFRIYIGNYDSTYCEYSGGQYCFEADTSIANGGNLTYEMIASDLPVNLRPRNPSVTRNGQNFILNLERNDFPGAGNGYNLSRRTVYVATMKVSTSAATINSPEFKMNWKDSEDSENSTRIFAYVNAVNTEITNPAYHDMDFMFPVELSDFRSNVKINNVMLNWSTVSENNNSGFDIERSVIKDEIIEAFEKISFVKGFGTTTLPKQYIFTDKNLNTGKYEYRLKQIDYNGNIEYFYLPEKVLIGVPQEFKLSQNYPNPFNPLTKISYELPKDGSVILKIFDNIGKEIRTIVNEFKSAGYYAIEIDGINLPSGLYFYRIVTNGFTETKRMILLK